MFYISSDAHKIPSNQVFHYVSLHIDKGLPSLLFFNDHPQSVTYTSGTKSYKTVVKGLGNLEEGQPISELKIALIFLHTPPPRPGSKTIVLALSMKCVAFMNTLENKHNVNKKSKAQSARRNYIENR